MTFATQGMRNRTRIVFAEVMDYLKRSGIFVPSFRHEIKRQMAGSYFRETKSGCFLRLGCYPTRFTTEWFVMHEVGHVLWYFYDPCRRREFNQHFGDEPSDDYERLHRTLSWYGPVGAWIKRRPHGEPSPYGAAGGGEERFCELLGLMYASGGFDQKPPDDLRPMWRACWTHGLSRMDEAEVQVG